MASKIIGNLHPGISSTNHEHPLQVVQEEQPEAKAQETKKGKEEDEERKTNYNRF